MVLLIGYFATHMVLVFSTGAWNNIKSMITGWYRLKEHDGVGI
jgi:thiosulfate reductase cytochrome b subunit